MIIFLVGFMGCGKSTIGKKVAHKLGYTFLDLDDFIEEKEGQTIAEIFTKYGESAFRQMEQAALKQVVTATQIVVATGGGTPCFQNNMAFMNQQGITIFLQETAFTLAQRLFPNKAHRPLISHFDTLETLAIFIDSKYQSRLPYYQQAQKTVIGANQSMQNLVEEICQKIAS